MGLSIGYEFSVAGNADRALWLVQELQRRAREMPFDEIHEILEWGSPDGRDDPPTDDGLARWLKINGTHYLKTSDSASDPAEEDATLPFSDIPTETFVDVEPLHLVGFTAYTRGAESATIGLATHPPAIERRRDGRVVTLPTGLGPEYRWRSACKTQYAAAPDCGGTENFLKAHLAVIQLLDSARELGIEVTVYDEGNYWETREQKVLLDQLRKYNGLVAAFTGKLKDTIGNAPGQVVSPITEYPDFEHMEADGLKHLRRGDQEST